VIVYAAANSDRGFKSIKYKTSIKYKIYMTEIVGAGSDHVTAQ
jgi:hypothetical protein